MGGPEAPIEEQRNVVDEPDLFAHLLNGAMMTAVEHWVSVITPGVFDIDRARSFYVALGGYVAHKPHWRMSEDGSIRLS